MNNEEYCNGCKYLCHSPSLIQDDQVIRHITDEEEHHLEQMDSCPGHLIICNSNCFTKCEGYEIKSKMLSEYFCSKSQKHIDLAERLDCQDYEELRLPDFPF